MSKEGPLLLPKFDYHLDESDPDVLVLRRQDGSFVAAFSACGATGEGIVEAAKEDYATLLRENASLRGLRGIGVPGRLTDGRSLFTEPRRRMIGRTSP